LTDAADHEPEHPSFALTSRIPSLPSLPSDAEPESTTAIALLPRSSARDRKNRSIGMCDPPGARGSLARIGEAVDHLTRATAWLLAKLDAEPEAALAGATPYLRLFGLAAGGCMLADEALAASRVANGEPAARAAIARFFAENIAVQASGLERTVIEGADSVNTADAALTA